MRVALIHYWLVTMRGGENVLEALLDLFPQADIFTHAYAPEAVSAKIRAARVNTTFIQKLPLATKAYQKYLPLMPLALEQLDLRGYDLVISSESGPAKGVLTSADTLHLCYCHTPMRYLWDMYQDYLAASGPITRGALRFFSHRLRLWDAASAQRVDYFAANSRNVARRIAKHYRREAEIIHPPVDVDFFSPQDGAFPEPEDYYLYVGQLVGYKRVDVAVDACTRLGKKLVVIGDGPERKRLEQAAGPGVTFLGNQKKDLLRRYMQRCKALLFPGEEDFGIVPLEAMASGRPVIAYGKGGALETVIPGKTGLLFQEQNVSSLCNALEEFAPDSGAFSPQVLLEHAGGFSHAVFRRGFSVFYERCRAAWEKSPAEGSIGRE
ncbi:MAG: glycosyltransferase [Desulfovibrionaceae bacterium]|nr:glycosyltransferase [Desulfovibrionaceae bacterium]